jgi:hypothetical protein
LLNFSLPISRRPANFVSMSTRPQPDRRGPPARAGSQQSVVGAEQGRCAARTRDAAENSARRAPMRQAACGQDPLLDEVPVLAEQQCQRSDA